MSERPRRKVDNHTSSRSSDERYYRDIRRKHIFRLLVTYVLPLALLSVYFYFRYDALVSESQRFHLKAIAENQANTLNLFLSERLVNIANLIDDPKLVIPPSSETMPGLLKALKKNSDTFVDIGFFDSSGVQTSYAGPYPSLEKRDYSSESWFRNLRDDGKQVIITDIYLGFRKEPHFTIAVSRTIDERFVALRATLDPRKMYEYITSLEGSNEVYTSIVNEDGFYQLVTPHIGTLLESSSVVPPKSPRFAVEEADIDGHSYVYAYSWLNSARWALIVQFSSEELDGGMAGFKLKFFGLTFAIILIILVVILNRARKLAEFQKESDRTKLQLEHAAKLASVGELAAGIAHEINNPLASINEEAGLMKDLISADFEQTATPEDLTNHLNSIQESVFRCRDITRKLLAFVRKTDTDLEPHDLNTLIDGVVDGLLGPEMAVSNVEIVKEYDTTIPKMVTDGHQLQQVLLNILNNALDALSGNSGVIAVATSANESDVRITISDNGSGMTADQLEKIFVPFFTTKEVGKGTGLGLSVSYGIVKNLGGTIAVESEKGKGSTFVITLPLGTIRDSQRPA